MPNLENRSLAGLMKASVPGTPQRAPFGAAPAPVGQSKPGIKGAYTGPGSDLAMLLGAGSARSTLSPSPRPPRPQLFGGPGQFNAPRGGMPQGLFSPVSMGAANPAALPFQMPARMPRAVGRDVPAMPGYGAGNTGADVFRGSVNAQTADAHIRDHQDAAARNRQLFIEKYGMTPEQAQALEAQKAAAMSRGSHGPGAGGGMGMG